MPKLAYDISSFLWRSMLGGIDEEHGAKVTYEDKQVHVNSAQWGYNRCMDLMLGAMKELKLQPIDCILVPEGMGSKSKRLAIYKEYKGSRDSRPPEAYANFHEAKEMLERAWLAMGAISLTQDYAEGDDVLGWLAENTEDDLYVATYDNDMAVLNGVNEYGATIVSWIDGKLGVNPYGPFAHHLITCYKALVGDSSDNIKGCPGFGPKAWELFIADYGYDGLQQFYDMCTVGDLGPLVSIPDKLIQKIVENSGSVLQSFEVASLHPEWVNIIQHPLQWKAGLVAMPEATEQAWDDRIKPYLASATLVQKDNYEDSAMFFLEKLNESPFITLDIETSTPDESDEWLIRKDAEDKVDQFGSKLTGLSLTFGANNQYTQYYDVDHVGGNNVKSFDVARLVEAAANAGKEIVIQNVSFELTVLWQEWKELGLFPDNGGFIPNVRDTKFEASYQNENIRSGLKERSQLHLGYTQVKYEEVTKISGDDTTLPAGGKVVAVDASTGVTTKQYKMKELTAAHVFNYGIDDTRCTAALHNFYKLFCQLEHTYKVYEAVELDAAYLHAQSYVRGMPISLEKMNELSADDDIVYRNSWAVVRHYLINKGWDGTIPPVYDSNITPAQIKEAYSIVTNKRLETMIRTQSKLVIFIREVAEEPVFAGMLERCLAGEGQAFTDYVNTYFKGEPVFNDGSTKQMAELMYEVMKLPIRVRNKLTPAARASGQREGSPKTDALAIAYALQECSEDQKEVLEALKLMAMVGTRRSLYYAKYPNAVHWKDGLVHSSHNQSSTVTRRASESDVNRQQMPKHPKIEGQKVRFREVVVPHKKNAVVLSMDFASQEYVIIASKSKDPNMLACFQGPVAERKAMHSLTGLNIYNFRHQDAKLTYEEFAAILEDKKDPRYAEVKECRTLGKKVNFTAEYGAAAPKVAQTLIVSEADAQLFLDARSEAFAASDKWKQSVIAFARKHGYVLTSLGARRHLADDLFGGDKWVASKAERQGVNFEVQGDAAEMTKLAEGRMFKAKLFERFDAWCYGPIHDEVVVSVAIDDLFEFIPAMHACMVQHYANLLLTPSSSISFGPDFGRQIEIGEEPTREAIEKGLAELAEIQ